MTQKQKLAKGLLKLIILAAIAATTITPASLPTVNADEGQCTGEPGLNSFITKCTTNGGRIFGLALCDTSTGTGSATCDCGAAIPPSQCTGHTFPECLSSGGIGASNGRFVDCKWRRPIKILI